MYNVVICGSGFMGKTHAQAYKNQINGKLVGIMGASQDEGTKLASELGIKYYDNFEDVLRNDAVDVIDICVPTFLHREFVEKGLAAGKHVMCEKPMALNLEDAGAIVNAAEKAGTKFMIAHNHRFYVENNYVHQMAVSGKLGKIYSCSAQRISITPDWSHGSWIIDPAKSGGAATDLLLHDIDLCNWIGGKPLHVMAQGIKSSRGAWDYMDISIDYDTGIKGFIEGGWMCKGQWPFTQEHRIMGENGVAQWVMHAEKNIEKRNTANSVIGVFLDGAEAEYPQWEKRDNYEIEIEYFLDCIKNNLHVEKVKAIDGYRAIQVSIAAKKSAETLQMVRIED